MLRAAVTTKAPLYFFSYARSDKDFVLKLATDLRAGGANVWVDQLDIVGGQRWDKAIEEALRSCQGMIVILSPEAVNSENVMDEVSFALGNKKLVVPVLYRSCEVPFRLQRLQRIDFTTAYQVGLAGLFRALDIEAHIQAAPQSEKAAAATATASIEAPAPQRSASAGTPIRLRREPKFGVRAKGALIGLACGIALGAASGLVFTGERNTALFAAAINALPGALAGVIVGDSRVRLVAAVVGTLPSVAYVLVLLLTRRAPEVPYEQAFQIPGLGAVFGAVAGILIEKIRERLR